MRANGANLVRMVAQIVSADALIADLWPRCAVPIALLVDGERMSVALREPDGDRLVYASNDDDTLPQERLFIRARRYYIRPAASLPKAWTPGSICFMLLPLR